MAAATTKILFIGGTGYIGKFIVEASAKAGHPTFSLFHLYDHESFVKAIKLVDVVISTVSSLQLPDQDKIISAIKEAGNVKRFFPSEFGNDVDRVHAVDPAKTAFAIKAKIRRTIEAEGIPYTYVASNFFAGYSLPTLSQHGVTAAPRDKVVILGDGNPKAVFNKEEDLATYTIKAVDDPRTLNKILYIRPPANTLSFNELVSLWEKKIGKTLCSRGGSLKANSRSLCSLNVVPAIGHSVYVKGDHTNFEIDPPFGVEASALYPDVKYTTCEIHLGSYNPQIACLLHN